MTLPSPHPALDVRGDFPALAQRINGQPLTYLDSAASTLKPTCVLETTDAYYRHTSANIHRGVHALSERATAAYEAARETIRAHINAADCCEVIFTSGTTDSINLAASCLSATTITAGDEVIVTELEHHSNIVPWQMACERTGAHLKVAPIFDNGELDLQAFQALLSERTRVVAATAVSNAIGTITPIREMVALAHDAGAIVLVDAAQAVATRPIDVQELGCDLLAFSGHKVFGPTGIGVLYGRQALLDRLPPYRGGGDMILSVSFEKTTYNQLPAKFEAGTPHIAGAIGLGRALDYVNAIGWPAIQQHEQGLLATAREALSTSKGVRLLATPRDQVAILSFELDGVHPHDIGTLLDRHGVAIRAGHHCAQPLMKRLGVVASARASFSIYNTPDDIERLLEALDTVRRLFQ